MQVLNYVQYHGYDEIILIYLLGHKKELYCPRKT